MADGEKDDETCPVVEGEDREALGWEEKDLASIDGWTPVLDNAPVASLWPRLYSGATLAETSCELLAVVDECDVPGCQPASPVRGVAVGTSRGVYRLDGAQLRRLKSLLRFLDFTDRGGTEMPGHKE